MTLPGNDRLFPPAGFLAALFAIALVPADSAAAEPALASVFGDHMVLQRSQPIRVWGWADPGEKVSVTLGQDTATTTAGPGGQWQAVLAARDEGGPMDMTVQGNNTLTLANVVVENCVIGLDIAESYQLLVELDLSVIQSCATGIRIAAGSSSNVLQNGVVQNNTGDGIRFEGADGSPVKERPEEAG